jgi:hypothetical protein
MKLTSGLYRFVKNHEGDLKLNLSLAQIQDPLSSRNDNQRTKTHKDF